MRHVNWLKLGRVLNERSPLEEPLIEHDVPESVTAHAARINSRPRRFRFKIPATKSKPQTQG